MVQVTPSPVSHLLLHSIIDSITPKTPPLEVPYIAPSSGSNA